MDIQNNNLLFVEIKHLIQTEDMDIWNYKNELTTLIDDEIARKSVKSEEDVKNYKLASLAITDLQLKYLP